MSSMPGIPVQDPVINHLQRPKKARQNTHPFHFPCYVQDCPISAYQKSLLKHHFNSGFHAPDGPGGTAEWDEEKVFRVPTSDFKEGMKKAFSPVLCPVS
jgi:hypothetical protein